MDGGRTPFGGGRTPFTSMLPDSHSAAFRTSMCNENASPAPSIRITVEIGRSVLFTATTVTAPDDDRPP